MQKRWYRKSKTVILKLFWRTSHLKYYKTFAAVSWKFFRYNFSHICIKLLGLLKKNTSSGLSQAYYDILYKNLWVYSIVGPNPKHFFEQLRKTL